MPHPMTNTFNDKYTPTIPTATPMASLNPLRKTAASAASNTSVSSIG